MPLERARRAALVFKHSDLPKSIRKRKWLVLPTNKYKLGWDGMMFVIVVYYMFTIPITICFGGTEPWLLEEDQTLDTTLFLVFVADMVLNFFVALDVPGGNEYIYNRRTIACNYLKGWFILDFVATFPVSMIVNETGGEES